MLDIQHGDRAEINNVRFENIRIEYRKKGEYPLIQETKDAVYENKDETYMPVLFELTAGTTMWSIDENSGPLRNVYFKNIEITTEDSRIPQGSKILVRDAEKKIKGVYFENITVNAKVCDADTLNVSVSSGVDDIFWKNKKSILK